MLLITDRNKHKVDTKPQIGNIYRSKVLKRRASGPEGGAKLH